MRLSRSLPSTPSASTRGPFQYFNSFLGRVAAGTDSPQHGFAAANWRIRYSNTFQPRITRITPSFRRHSLWSSSPIRVISVIRGSILHFGDSNLFKPPQALWRRRPRISRLRLVHQFAAANLSCGERDYPPLPGTDYAVASGNWDFANCRQM